MEITDPSAGPYSWGGENVCGGGRLCGGVEVPGIPPPTSTHTHTHTQTHTHTKIDEIDRYKLYLSLGEIQEGDVYVFLVES